MVVKKKLNLILFNLNPDGTVVEEMIQHFEEGSRYNLALHKFSTQEEIQKLAPTIPNGVILFCVFDSDSLTALINSLKFLKPFLKKNFFKVCGFNDLNNSKVETVLQKSGASEVIDPDINLKTIRYKVDVWQKSLKSQKVKTFSASAEPPKEIVIEQKTSEPAPKKVETEASTETQSSKEAQPPSSKTKNDRTRMITPPSIDIEEDIWILKNSDDCKLIIKKWFVRLLGPGPNIVKWEKVPTPNASRPMFKLVPRDNENSLNEHFFFPEGAWYFYGTKPEFDWKLKGWNFTGEFINLFYRKGEVNTERLALTNEGLKVPENSSKALSIEHHIMATILTEEGQEVKSDSTPLDGHYQGDINEDGELQEGHLKGKTDGTDNESTENLTGDIKTEKLANENLKGKQGKEQDQKGHWKGSFKDNQVQENKNAKSTIKYDGPKYRGMARKASKTPPVDPFSDKPTLDGPELDKKESQKASTPAPKKAFTQVDIPAPEKIDQLLDEFLEDISIESGELKINLLYPNPESNQEDEIECKLFDMFDGEITLKTVTGDEIEPERVNLSLVFQYNNQENKIDYQGDVTDITPTPDDQFYISIKLENFDQSIFDQFLEQYEERQANVSKFLDRVKGTG